MTKEIYDKIIYVLLALAILISFLGTFFVYHKASEINSNVVVGYRIIGIRRMQ